MKNAFWAYWLILLGVLIVVIMLLVRNLTTTSTQDYYLVKEITNAALVDAVDYSYYRNYGELRINKEKFYESFLRRFAETANLSTTYTISFYGVYEAPPKVSVEIRSKSNTFTVAGDSTSFDMVERIDSILEGKPLPKVTSDLTEIEENTPKNPTEINADNDDDTEDVSCKKIENIKDSSYNGLSYNLYASNNADTCAKIIIYLHGGGKESGIEEFASRGFGNFIMIEPRKTSSGSWGGKLAVITQIVDKVKKDYNIETDEIVVTGVSDGSHGALLFASLYSDLVSAVYAVAGSSDPIKKSSSLTGYEKVDLSKISAPVRMAVGESDGYYRLMYNDLAELQNYGIKVHMTSVPNVGHDLNGLSGSIFQKEDFDCMLNPSKNSCYGVVSTNCDGNPSNYELQGMHGTAMVASLAVYKKSDLSGTPIKTLTPGEEIFSIVGEKGNAWQIIVDGQCGWIKHDFAAIDLNDYLSDTNAIINITNDTSSLFNLNGKNINNVTNFKLYDYKQIVPVAYEFAKKLHIAALNAESKNHKLVIVDAYRPYSISNFVRNSALTTWRDNQSEYSVNWTTGLDNYILGCDNGSGDCSLHNYGCAVDVVLDSIKSVSGLHDLSNVSSTKYDSKNSLHTNLYDIMVGNNGFTSTGLQIIGGKTDSATEWWHYELSRSACPIKKPLNFWSMHPEETTRIW